MQFKTKLGLVDIPNGEVLRAAGSILESAKPEFINPHIIVGPGRRCLCGMYDGKPVSCGDILAQRALVESCG